LEPLLTTLVLTLVFGNWFGRGSFNFPVYILCGRLIYSFFANSTKAAMKAIRSNGNMIKKVYVPKYIYPLSAVLSGYVMFLISLIILFLAMLFFKVNITIYLIQAILPLIIILVMSLGVGLILSTMAVFFRDLEYLWGVILMLIMYSSAIFYEVDKMVSKGNGWIFKLNPLYAVILNLRNAVFGAPLNQFSLGYSCIFSIVSLIIGIVVFYKYQNKFILNI
jgi:ABC-2 type transport system permease protein